jgi:hypothetical protein
MKRITLHKTDGTQIGVLHDILSPNIIKPYSGVGQLNFSIPIKVEDRATGKMVRNPYIDLIKERYKIKYDDRWYIISKIDRKSQETKKYIDIQCNSLAYVLRDKRLKNFKTGTSDTPVKNLTDTANLILSKAGWSVGTVTPLLDTLYRVMDISSKTVLDALNDLCEKWDCVWQEDSVNKKINFIDYKTDGAFTGLSLSKHNYLKGINYSMDEASLITRLHIYGKDGISVHAVNFGKDYIDDLSYYKTTDYMSQSLIDSLNAYEQDIANKATTYEGYLTQIDTLTQQQYSLENEIDYLMHDADTGVDTLLKKRDAIVFSGGDVTTIDAQIDSQSALVGSKLQELANVQNQITTINGQIDALVASADISNYISANDQAYIQENFIIEQDFNDSAITERDDGSNTVQVLKDLLAAGKKFLALNNQPRFNCTLDVVAFTQLADPKSVATAQKLRNGDLVLIQDTDLNINIEAKVVEIQEDIYGHTLNVKIANQKDIKSGFVDVIRKAASTANLVALNANSWNRGGEANDLISDFLNNAIDTTAHNIISGDNNFQLNNRGLVMTDNQFEMILTSKGLLLSENGNSSVAIGQGMVNGQVIGGDIIIGHEAKLNSLKVYDTTGTDPIVEVGKYFDGTTEKRGIKINAGNLDIVGSFSPTLSYNNININSIDGITVTRQDNKTRTLMNGVDGFKVQKSTGTNTWNDLIGLDTNGDVYVGGVIDAVKDLRINGSSILNLVGNTKKIAGGYIDAKGMTVRNVVSDEMTFQVDNNGNSYFAGNITMKSGSITWANVNKPSQNDLGTWTTKIDATGLYTGTISADKITGNTLTAINQLNIGDQNSTNIAKSIQFIDGAKITTNNYMTALYTGITISSSYTRFSGGYIELDGTINFTTNSNIPSSAYTNCPLVIAAGSQHLRLQLVDDLSGNKIAEFIDSATGYKYHVTLTKV